VGTKLKNGSIMTFLHYFDITSFCYRFLLLSLPLHYFAIASFALFCYRFLCIILLSLPLHYFAIASFCTILLSLPFTIIFFTVAFFAVAFFAIAFFYNHFLCIILSTSKTTK
jgi:hypothetical protein